MTEYQLTQISQIVNGSLQGKDAIINDVSIDSRSLQKDALFVALKGPNFDGHDYVIDAQKKGALAAIVERVVNGCYLPQLIVKDCYQALGEWAAYHRSEQRAPLIAITGSCGKTTTKTMLASILAECGNVLVNEGNLNNHIGMPLTLLQLTSEHDYAVVELGANHFGEIDYLTKIARPDVAAVIHVGAAHLAGFGGSVAGVARAKGEIFGGLQQQGIAIINKDEQFSDYFHTLIGAHQQITFSRQQRADVYARDITVTKTGSVTFALHIGNDATTITLPTLGEHNVLNALAASACALAVVAPLTAIKKGLENMRSVEKRMIKCTGLQGMTIIDDSYNAIPDAVNHALKVLSGFNGKRIFAFGGMAELGPGCESEHRRLGKYARKLGVDYLYAMGEYSYLTIDNFGQGGKYFTDKKALIAALKQLAHKDVTLLVKGSRDAQMEDVVAALVNREQITEKR